MTLFHEVLGDSSGPTVVMSSGLGGSATYWKPQIPALLDRGFRVIVYDQSGTGRSRPATLKPGYAIDDMAAEVMDIVESTGTKTYHFVGHALGGLVGLSLAKRDAPGLQTLTLVNAWAKICGHTERCFEARLSLLSAFGPDAYVKAQPIFLYPAAWAEQHEAVVNAEVHHGIAHFPGEETMLRRIEALRAFDVSASLSTIQLPVFVSASTDDVLVPWTQSRKLADQLPRCESDFVSSGGHAHNVTEPEAFNAALIGFFDRHAAL